ncbi:MAG: hypothetical protein DWH78_07990 [Planctomycetota bacterium]|nr:MAG: hypothetical protein DWH78_07990 [Planctomycetota bacterium]
MIKGPAFDDRCKTSVMAFYQWSRPQRIEGLCLASFKSLPRQQIQIARINGRRVITFRIAECHFEMQL